jgi:hypothetical protein
MLRNIVVFILILILPFYFIFQTTAALSILRTRQPPARIQEGYCYGRNDFFVDSDRCCCCSSVSQNTSTQRLAVAVSSLLGGGRDFDPRDSTLHLATSSLATKESMTTANDENDVAYNSCSSMKNRDDNDEDNSNDFDGRQQQPTETDQNPYQDDGRTLYHLPPPPSGETFRTEKDDYDLDALIETLKTDGVVVLPSVYSNHQIEPFRKAHEENFRTVKDLMAETEAVQKPY